MTNIDWTNIFDKYDSQDVVSGTILRIVPGGASVDVFGKVAFLPWSQVPLTLKSIPESIPGQKLEFKILKLNTNGDNIVVSRKEMLEQERQIAYKEALKSISIGDEIDSVVKTIVSYGVFVKLNELIDGLIPSKELSWKRFSNLNTMVKPGDIMKVKVIEINENKITLSHKLCTPSPWESFDTSVYQEGIVVPATVVKIINSGVILELDNGCQAYLHISEVTWETKSPDLNSLFSVDDKLNVIITMVDLNNHKIQVSLKRLSAKPINLLKPGRVLFCTIDSKDGEGVHMHSSSGMPVFLPYGEISWLKHYDLNDYINNRNQIRVVILKNNIDGKVNIASIRRLSTDPMVNYVKNTYHTGIVSGESPNVYFVSFKDGLTGIIPKISLKRITLSKNQKVKTSVVNADRETRHLILAIESEFSGNDIMQMLGLKPGKEVGILKKNLSDAVKEGIIDMSYEAGKAFVKQKAIELKIIVE